MKLLIAALIGLSGFSQYSAYPKNYFRNPLDIPIDLSANFGELRSNHWHMGLDIRTQQKVNQRVYAAAGGYIARIGIRPQSFGRFIVINHPNGLSTLYAHLNDFYPALEEWVKSEQYRQESWAVELTLSPTQFPVDRGTFIAYSGNTGGSMGPHLHFEIFDTQSEKRLNPLLFNFGISDNVPPTILKLAMYDRSRSIHGQSPVFYSLKKTADGYTLTKPIETGLSRVSFAIQAYDRLSGSNNPNGIFSGTLYFDDTRQSGFVLDSIDYDETLYMNAHIDYGYKQNGGSYLQQLSRMPGDFGSAYRDYAGNGVIVFTDTVAHQVHIEVKDAHGNASLLIFSIRHNEALARDLPARSARTMLEPGTRHLVRKSDFEGIIQAGALYDSIPSYYLRTKGSQANAASDIHQFNSADIPLHLDFEVRVRIDRSIPASWQDRLLLIRSGDGNTIRPVKPVNGWVSAAFRDFGKFQVVADLQAPTLNAPGKGDTINLSKSSRIVFSPKDNYGIVKKFRAELDGKWIRFTNDKSRNWIYEFDEHWPAGVRALRVRIEDHAGNVTEEVWWIRRE